MSRKIGLLISFVILISTVATAQVRTGMRSGFNLSYGFFDEAVGFQHGIHGGIYLSSERYSDTDYQIEMVLSWKNFKTDGGRKDHDYYLLFPLLAKFGAGDEKVVLGLQPGFHVSEYQGSYSRSPKNQGSHLSTGLEVVIGTRIEKILMYDLRLVIELTKNYPYRNANLEISIGF